jgi:FKBP-type peptidyl-prolyl cis-trans isomerase FkpA
MNIRILFIVLLSISFACSQGSRKNEGNRQPGKKEMEELNKYFVQKDRERIENYIERKSLTMKETSSGLWYQILSEGEGSFYSDNSRIVFEYQCSLLDGQVCYSSDQSGPKEIILGRSVIEAGLDQGLRLLKPGSRAILILPPFLAYGLKGDGKKIPSKAIIVYNISTLRPVNKLD